MKNTGAIMSTIPRREFPQVPDQWIKQELVSVAKLIRAMKEDA